jgi:hypothetical protein
MPLEAGAREALAAVVLTVSMEGPEPLGIDEGLNAHFGAGVTVGATLHDRVTALLNPFTGVTVIVEVADPPGEIAAGVGAEAATEKSAAEVAATFKLTGAVVWLSEPDAPVTVTVNAPTGVVAEVPTVRVEVPVPPAIEAGLNAHVGAGVTTGLTLHDKLAALENPFTGATVIVEVADPPAVTVAGESVAAAIVKSGVGEREFTVRLTAVVWVKDPETPLIVTL